MAVYFARTGVDGPFVKIGFAVDVASRVRVLDAASPFPLVLLRAVDGNVLTERWYHRRFAQLRVKNEWFRFSPEMLTVEAPHIAPRNPRHVAFGEYLRKHGISTKDFAAKIGVCAETIRLYATGDRVPRIDVLTKIAEATGGTIGPAAWFPRVEEAQRKAAAAS